MSRLKRAWREMRRSDDWYDLPKVDPLEPYGYALTDLVKPLVKIAASMERMERRKRRSRIVACEHPELHPDLREVA
jgi:hypothetical protein